MKLDVRLVPLLRDNYAYLLRSGDSVAIVDPSEAAPALELLKFQGLSLDYILNTHHHPDHSGGNLGLKEATGAKVVGPAADRDRIPGIDIALADGERFDLGGSVAEVMEIPGHTKGHIAFWFEDQAALFCGDTLFAMGCGRMFEGTPEQMWHSLSRLAALPHQTRVYCGHEYTEANARFALTVEPGNFALKQRAEQVGMLRRGDRPTIPSTIGEERATNPFLRVEQPAIAEAVGLPGAGPVHVFAELRKRKDNF